MNNIRGEVMEAFKEFLNNIEDLDRRLRVEQIFEHISTKFPNLESVIKWNQPMFTDHGTFIIGFSIAKNHLAVAPEAVTLNRFEKEIQEAGYQRTNQLLKIPWKHQVDFGLLERIIAFNIEDKKTMTKFWRE